MEQRKVRFTEVLKAMLTDWYDRKNPIIITAIIMAIVAVEGAIFAAIACNKFFELHITPITIGVMAIGAVLGACVIPLCYKIGQFITFCKDKKEDFMKAYYDKKYELMQEKF